MVEEVKVEQETKSLDFEASFLSCVVPKENLLLFTAYRL